MTKYCVSEHEKKYFWEKTLKFLDLVKVYIRSGSGGSGCVSFRREKFLEFGGPDGGDGGNGGSVQVKAVNGLNTLIDFRYRQHYFAKNGQPGMGRQRYGATGANVVLNVPIGTEILDEDGETVIAELIKEDEKFCLAVGGNGGWGNLRFKSSTNQAPRKANPGQLGEERTIWLRLKLIADIGIFGLPNAGKSTFLSINSNAKPKIADYPFTTLYPNLGVVSIDNHELIFADIPGLIEGAHSGKGLGTRFLGHIERCSSLLHLIDATSENIVKDRSIVMVELKKYGSVLTNKKIVTVLNKIDALDITTMQLQLSKLRELTEDVFAVSAISGQGMPDLLRRLNDIARINLENSNDKNTEPLAWTP